MGAVIDGYARAALEMGRGEEVIDQVSDELFRLGRLFETSDELRSTLANALIPFERKEGIINDLLGDKAHRITTGFVTMVSAAGRVNDLPEITQRITELAASTRAKTVAEVRSALELDSDTVRKLEDRLSQTTGLAIEAKVVVDPTIIGGIIARVGDTVYDGSVLARLRKLREDVQKV
ncbi:MAG: ATP synthase F1 subunit delta [Acidimicrobiia bacterium]|nr:ATP synthase F1 subunit delta [Acidimicrobiia bacterium]